MYLKHSDLANALNIKFSDAIGKQPGASRRADRLKPPPNLAQKKSAVLESLLIEFQVGVLENFNFSVHE